MLKKYWLDAAFILVEASLGFVAYVQNSPVSLYQIASAQITLLIVYVALVTHRNSVTSENLNGAFEKTSADIRNLLGSQSEVRAISEEDFYSRFELDVFQAKDMVLTAHLDVNPPLIYSGTRAEQYYERVFRAYREKPAVRFERIEVVGPEKIQWIDEYLEKCTELKNFSLKVLPVEDYNIVRPYLSVQLIDTDLVYLVAIAKHHDKYRPRDIFIRSAEVSQLFVQYYEEKLLRLAKPVLTHGKLVGRNWEEIKTSWEV